MRAFLLGQWGVCRLCMLVDEEGRLLSGVWLARKDGVAAFTRNTMNDMKFVVCTLPLQERDSAD